MSGTAPQTHSSVHTAAVATPVKQPGVVQTAVATGGGQYNGCPYGSPISGLCTGTPGVPAASTAKTRLYQDTASTARPRSVQPTPGVAGSPQVYGSQQKQAALASSTSSMPELWQSTPNSGQATPRHFADWQQQQQVQQLRLSADNRPRRDQDQISNSPQMSPRPSIRDSSPLQQLSSQDPTEASQCQPVPQQALLPVDVLLSPLLPSADEQKLVDRLSQLRHALDEHVRLAAGWEQQVGCAWLSLSAVQPHALWQVVSESCCLCDGQSTPCR